MKTRKQSFIQGAATLGATMAVIKVMGAVYKIPLFNILGDEGTSYFGIALSIYALLLTLSTAGLPVALSRLVAAADAQGRTLQIKRTFRVALGAFTVLGIIGTAVMMLFSKQLAAFQNNLEAAPSIVALGPSVVLVCVMSAYRGYTQGLSDMVPTSVSQIIEVGCKLAFGLTLASMMAKRGYSPPMVSAGAIFGIAIGELLALIYSWAYKRYMDRDGGAPSAQLDVPESRGRILEGLIKIGVPIALCSSVLNILGLVDSPLIMGRLQNALNYSYEDSKILYGAYTKVQPLFNLPSNFITPLTISAIPAISTYLVKKDTLRARRVAEGAIKLTALVGIPAAVGLSVLAAPIIAVLYPDTNAASVSLLRWLGPAGFFVCLMVTTNAILQAHGHERMPIYSIIVGGVIKVAVIWVLLSNPDVGINGAAIGSLVCYAVVSVINILIISAKVPDKPRMLRQLIKPLLPSLIMGAAAVGSNAGLRIFAEAIGLNVDGRAVTCLCMAGAIVVAVAVYALLIVVFRVITADDLELMPKGERIARILRIKI